MDPVSPELYYACDDLKKEQQAGKYKNKNPEWEKYYNATLVVPIGPLRIGKSAPADDEAGVIGFICVDNLKGRLANTFTHSVLEAYATTQFLVHQMFAELTK